MKTFWLFRTNLRQYEYYHSIDNLEQFKKQCHDFYLLMGIWMLENTELEEFVVWRLVKEQSGHAKYSGRKEFEVNGKKFIQLFVDDFNDCFQFEQFPRPDITLFRGGFPDYGKITKANPNYFGLKLYLGAGQRVFPKYGGIYDKILVEDERDMNPNFDCIPFYKTANPNIFYPMDLEKKWNICWPCNFSQEKYKGQEWFIKQVAKSDYLKSLKILHVGNVPKRGRDLCKKYGVNNIVFKGWVTRPELNEYLNQSNLGLVTSNELDGSPRILTEILCTGIPVGIRYETRCWSLAVNNNTQKDGIYGLRYAQTTKMTLEIVCQGNLDLWNV